MDRLEAMAILIAAVETGSLSGAGRKLGVPLATISRKVSDLESHLKTRLLMRSTRKLALTDAGADYVASCKRILELVGDAERKATGEYSKPRGDLVVTAPIVFGRLHVLPAAADFLEAYPDINLRLTLSDRNANLIDDHIDVAVRIGTLPDSALMATTVGSVRRIVCGSPAYFMRHGTPLIPEDLSPLTCVTFDGLAPATAWDFGLPNKAASPISIRARLSVNTAEAAIDAAVAGVGVTRILSYQAAARVAEGKLRVVLEQYEPPPLPVSLIHDAQGLMPLKTRAFLDFLAPRLRRALSSSGAPN